MKGLAAKAQDSTDRSISLHEVSTDHQTKALRIAEPEPTNWLREIALELRRMNERADADAKVFQEMVDKGNGLSA